MLDPALHAPGMRSHDMLDSILGTLRDGEILDRDHAFGLLAAMVADASVMALGDNITTAADVENAVSILDNETGPARETARLLADTLNSASSRHLRFCETGE